MGGVIIIGATLLGWLGALLLTGRAPSVSAVLVLFLMTGLGVVGFLDDFIKISRQRSLGLSPRLKILGQGVIGVVFAVAALQFPNSSFRTPASTHVSFILDTNLNLVFGAYVIVGVCQTNQTCQAIATAGPRCYEVRDPLSLAVVAAANTGACFGFLWWNASPAKIFMGDTGSLSLGAALAGFAIFTRTEMLLIILGGLFVVETLSVMVQVGFFKATKGRRVFRMAPLHHHFEMLGWEQVTVVIRFWIITGLCVAAGLGVFYAEWVAGI